MCVFSGAGHRGRTNWRLLWFRSKVHALARRPGRRRHEEEQNGPYRQVSLSQKRVQEIVAYLWWSPDAMTATKKV